MGTSNAKAVQAVPPLRRDLYRLQETLAAVKPNGFHCYAATHVAVAATGNWLHVGVHTTAIFPMTKGRKHQSVFLAARRSSSFGCISDSPVLLPLDALIIAVAADAAFPVVNAAYPVASAASTVPTAAAVIAAAVVCIVAAEAAAFASGAAAMSGDSFAALRAGLGTGVLTSSVSVAASAASIPSALAGGLVLAAVTADLLMTSSAAALTRLDAAASASVTSGILHVASDSWEDASGISAATGQAVTHITVVLNIVYIPLNFSVSTSSCNEPVSANITTPAACETLPALPSAPCARILGGNRLACAEYAVVVAVLGADDRGLRQQQQHSGAETTRVELQKQHHLGIDCVHLSFLRFPPSCCEARLFSFVSSSQQHVACHKNHGHSFSDCCCGDVSAAAVITSSALQASKFLFEASRVCSPLWHSSAFCCLPDVREKQQGHLAGAAVTLLTVVLLTVAFQAALSSTAASALCIDTAALAGTSIAVCANTQRPLSRVVIARPPGVDPFVSVAVPAISAAAPGGVRRVPARPGACTIWPRFVALRVADFDSSALASLATPAADESFTDITRWRAVFPGVTTPPSQCRRNTLAAAAAALLRRLDTRSAAVGAGPSSAAVPALIPFASSQRSAAAVAVAHSDRRTGTDACSFTHGAALLHASAQRKRSCAAAALGENYDGAPAASALAASPPTASSRAAPSPAASSFAAPAGAEFAASTSAAEAPSLSCFARAAATASARSRIRRFALIRSLRLQAPLLELQLPRLLLRLPLRALSIHLRYKLHSSRSSSSNSSNSGKYVTNKGRTTHTRRSDNSSGIEWNSGRESSRLHKSSFSTTSTDSENRNGSSTFGKDSRSIPTQPHTSSEEEDRNRNNAQRHYSLNTTRSSKIIRNTALEEVDALGSEAESTVDSSSRSSSVYGDDNTEIRSSIAEEHERKEAQRLLLQQKKEDESTATAKRETAEGQAAGDSNTPVDRNEDYRKQIAEARLGQPTAAAAVRVQHDSTGLHVTLQQDALLDQHGMQQQQEDVLLSARQQQQEEIATFVPQRSGSRETASTAVLRIPKAAEAKEAAPTLVGVAYQPTEAAKIGERTLKAIAAIGGMVRAWASPSIGVDIHPASNTLCFVAEAFPLKPAAASCFTKTLFHFFFPPSAAALLRVSLFPDGFCMISSAVISPAAIVSHLLLLFGSSNSREEEREKPKKRLLVQAGLQHRWVEKLMQLLQVQLVAGCNLLHAVLAPRSAFFTLLLLGRPLCCPRGMRRCYRKALFQQQRRLWRQQQQLGVRQQQEQQQQQELHQVWDVPKHKQSGNITDHVSPESLKRWYSSSKRRTASSSDTLFRRDLAFLVLRSGAAGDAEEEEIGPAASGSETFVAKLAFVAAGSSSRDTGNSSRTRAVAAAVLDTEEDEEDDQGKQTQKAFPFDVPVINSDNTKKRSACVEHAVLEPAEGCSRHRGSVQQRALRWLRRLFPQGVPTTARSGKSSSSGSLVTDPVLIDYREAAAVTEAIPTLHFSSRLLNRLLGESQLFCSAIARGRVQWSGSDAGAAVDLHQVLATAQKARHRRKQLQRMQQTSHTTANQTQVDTRQREGEQHVQQQQTQKQQRNNQEHERQAQQWRVWSSDKGQRAVQRIRSCAVASESAATVGQPGPLEQQTTLQQQQLLEEQEQQQAAEGEEPSPWSVLLRAGDVTLDVDHLTLRLELVPADTATAASTPTPTLQYLA